MLLDGVAVAVAVDPAVAVGAVVEGGAVGVDVGDSVGVGVGVGGVDVTSTSVDDFGVTEFETSEATLLPALLIALTVNE